MLTRDGMRWFTNHYLKSSERGRSDWRASPLRAPSLAGLPPALVITAGFDPAARRGRGLRDAADSDAAVRVDYVCYGGMIHGFMPMGRLLDTGNRATSHVAALPSPGAALTMNIGISVPLPAYHVDVGFMARKAEELGFESFWCAEHPFIPVHTASRFPGSADGVIPETTRTSSIRSSRWPAPPGRRSRIKLGTGIVLVPERNPLLLAKEISTLDLFSGGRFLVRHRRGLAPRGDRDHGRRLRPPLDADARVDPGHEGAVDQAAGRVPRQVLQLPAR